MGNGRSIVSTCVLRNSELLIIALTKINLLLFLLPWKFQVYLPDFLPFLLNCNGNKLLAVNG